MADEAFALSPIAAQSASPTDGDYDAIREAFMETARGRWFLGEYAKRNRNSDTAMVLDAVARIEQSLALSRTEPAAMAPAADNASERSSAPASGEIIDSIKTILERTRAALVAALSVPDMEQALSPFQRSARIIQEIAWGLRESGSDGRICNILDVQVHAMTTACEAFAAAEHRDAVLHAFDASLVQIGKLSEGGIAPSAAEPAATADSSLHVAPQSDTQTLAAATEATIPEMNAAAVEALQVQIVVETAVPAAKVEKENMSAPSLGDSLIARGIVASTIATSDPLAPIRRMSQAEKIAFFS